MDINNSLKEIQKKTGRQVKELNKAIQDLKVEVETIKETQMEAILEMEHLGKRSGITYVSITKIMQEREERASGGEDTVEKIDKTVKENSKNKKTPNPKHPGNLGYNEKKIKMENKDSQLKEPENVFNKIIEENLPNLKKEMAIKVQ